VFIITKEGDMKKNVWIVGAIAIVLLACNTQTDGKQKTVSEKTISADSIKEVSYETGKGYFVKNTIEDKDLTLKITTQADFDKYFGTATVMGERGKPTVIDFSKQFVLAVIAESSSKEKNITMPDIKSKDNGLHISYKIEEGIEQTFVSRPVLLLLIDNAYNGDVKFHKE